MQRTHAQAVASVTETDRLWPLLEENIHVLVEMTVHRKTAPEYRQRLRFVEAAIKELRRRGEQSRLYHPSEGNVARNAIFDEAS